MPDQWAKAPPPTVRRGAPSKYDWRDIVTKLTARPGEWLLIDPTARRGLDSAIRRQKMAALRIDGWRFVPSIRKTDMAAGTCELWMKAERI